MMKNVNPLRTGADNAGSKNLQVFHSGSRLFVMSVLRVVMCLTTNCDTGHRSRLHNDRTCWRNANK